MMDQLAAGLHIISAAFGIGIIIGLVIGGAMVVIALVAWIIGWTE